VRKQQRHILDALRGRNPVDFSTPSDDPQPAKGTCEWICSTSNYVEWKSSTHSSSLLWIVGGPGSGKTFLSNFIARRLDTDKAIVCKYSFNGNKETPLDFLSSIISQALLKNDHELSRYAIQNWDATDGAISWDSLWSFWTNICENLNAGKIFWVIDALDECSDSAIRIDILKRLSSLLQKLKDVTDSRVCFRILLTSRPETWRELPTHINQETSVLSRILLENESAIDDDIKSFIHNEVQMLAEQGKIMNKDIDKLRDRLCDGADRTFIWPQLTIEALRNDPECYDETTWDVYLRAIPSDLEGIYEKLLTQLSKTTANGKRSLPPRTKKLFQFVLAGQGHFTESELNILLALESKPETIAFAEKLAGDIGPIVERVYGSFLRRITDTNSISHVRLFHDTARKHLLLPSKSNYAMELPECHLELAKACVSYLWLDDMDEVSNHTGGETINTTSAQRPLIRYISIHWAHHVRESEELMMGDLLQQVVGMYNLASQRSSRRYQNWMEAYWSSSSCAFGGSTTTPLQMCAYNGHSRVLQKLLGKTSTMDLQTEIDRKDNAGNTALHYAAKFGRSKSIVKLLEVNADATVRNNAGLAALHMAVVANEKLAVLALFDGGVNVDIRTDGESRGRTVLHLAAESGLRAMVELLVEHGANIDILDSSTSPSTAAKIAFDKGHGAIAQFLDSKQPDSGITDLDQAILGSDEARVRSLVLHHGASSISKDNRGSTPLHRAARVGNVAIVGFLLDASTSDTANSTSVQDDDGMTPLHVASRYGHTTVMDLLFAKQVSVDAKSADGLTPLHEGILSGKRVVIDRLLDADADQFRIDRNGNTPLFIASSLGYDDLVNFLLRKESTRRVGYICNDLGQLPIHIAAKNGHVTTVKALLDHGEDTLDKVDREGRTPLCLAACGNSKSHAETVKYLVERGSEIAHKQLNRATPLLQAAQNGNDLSIRYLIGEDCRIPNSENLDLNEWNSDRLTPLSLAAIAGHESAVLTLLRNGAKDRGTGALTNRDLLSWVAGHGMTEALRLLLGTPEILVDSLDEFHRTPLSWASGNGHLDVVTQLLDSTGQTTPVVNVNSVDRKKRTPLSWAAAAGHEVVVKILLKYGADPTIKSEGGKSPVVWAVTEGHTKVFSALVDNCGLKDEDMVDNSRNPLLALAAENGKTEIVKLLLEHSSSAINNPNTPKKLDGHIETPLMLAAKNGYEDIVGVLLARDVDVHAHSPANNVTALLSAVAGGHWIIVEMLIKHDPSVLQVKAIKDETPLVSAVKYGHYETMKVLLDSKCDPSTRDPGSGQTLLHQAAQYGRIQMLMELLKCAGHCIKLSDHDHMTPLVLAAHGGQEQIVKALLKYAMENNIATNELIDQQPGQDSVLIAAVKGRNAEVVKMILRLFTDDDSMCSNKNRDGYTPMTLAAESGDTEILHQLLHQWNVNEQGPQQNEGPLISASIYGDEETVRLLLTKEGLKVDLDRYAKNSLECTSLWGAVWAGNYHIVKLLLADQYHQTAPRKVWLNTPDGYPGYIMSPLHLAVKFRHVDIVKVLLKERDIQLNTEDNNGSSAFLYSIETGDEYLVRTLAETPGIDVDHRDHQRQSALMIACKYGYLNIARYLLRECQNFSLPIDTLDNQGHDALFHAVLSATDNPTIVQLLIDSSASVTRNFPPSNSNLLMLASKTGSLQIVKILCETQQLDIEAKDINGYTALYIAAAYNQSNVVKFLLAKGADPNSTSRRSGRTVLMEAAYNGCEAAIRELILSPHLKLNTTYCNSANRSSTWFLLHGPGDIETAKQLNKYQHSSVPELFLEFHHDKVSFNEVDVQGMTPLLLAAHGGHGSLFQLRRLLQLQADFKYQSWTGISVFHIAALKSSPGTIFELLEATKSNDTLDSKDLDDATPLSLASGNSIEDLPYFGTIYSFAALSSRRTELETGRSQIAQMLIDRGANVNSTTLNEGRTPLMFAAKMGWRHIVCLLLESGANIDMKDKNYSTALSFAVVGGFYDIARHLLEADATYNIKDKTGATLVILAAEHGHLRILRLFVDSHNLGINDRDRDGRTALSYAAECGHDNIVHYLLEQHSVEVDALDRQDQTALVWACKGGHCLIVSLLKEHGANDKRKDKHGRSAFSHAAENGQSEVLRQLLTDESDESILRILEWKDDSGRTALSWAAEEGRLDVVALLLRWGADPLEGDKRKQTPRLFALDKGHTRVAKMLSSDYPYLKFINGKELRTELSPILEQGS
jgi:ankyrin repeat protein